MGGNGGGPNSFTCYDGFISSNVTSGGYYGLGRVETICSSNGRLDICGLNNWGWTGYKVVKTICKTGEVFVGMDVTFGFYVTSLNFKCGVKANAPTAAPTSSLTAAPTSEPTVWVPTEAPTYSPTADPTSSPTTMPTATPALFNDGPIPTNLYTLTTVRYSYCCQTCYFITKLSIFNFTNLCFKMK